MPCSDDKMDSAVMASGIFMCWHLRGKCAQEEGSVSVAHAAMDYSRPESRKVLD